MNAAIDHIRSRGPKGRLQSLPDDDARLGEGGVERRPGADPGQAYATSELQRAFAQLAEGLAPKQRAVFVLKEIEGLETPEVARILDVTESTVRNHLHAIYERVGVSGRRELLGRFVRGLIEGNA